MTSASGPVVGFHCSHEQHAPSQLLRLAQRAEEAGFAAAMCSDHFHPWTTAQGQAGHAWPWLGAAMQATQMSFGVVCAPGQRYHPAVVAQAAATLSELYPHRFWLAVGSGEALNESITGAGWPAKAERQQRLLECVQIIRALWAGETVTHDGLVTVRNATLFSRPDAVPLLVGAALSPETAEWTGGWADALITVSGPRDQMRAVRDAFRRGGGEHKPIWLQAVLALGSTDDESLQLARTYWPQSGLPGTALSDVATPAAFDHATRAVSDDKLRRAVRASADVEQQIAWLHEDVEMGFARVYLHSVQPNHQRFFERLASRVSGEFSRGRGSRV